MQVPRAMRKPRLLQVLRKRWLQMKTELLQARKKRRRQRKKWLPLTLWKGRHQRNKRRLLYALRKRKKRQRQSQRTIHSSRRAFASQKAMKEERSRIGELTHAI